MLFNVQTAGPTSFTAPVRGVLQKVIMYAHEESKRSRSITPATFSWYLPATELNWRRTCSPSSPDRNNRKVVQKELQNITGTSRTSRIGNLCCRPSSAGPPQLANPAYTPSE